MKPEKKKNSMGQTSGNQLRDKENNAIPPLDSKLLPIMREAVGLVHMVLYIELKNTLSTGKEKKFPSIKKLSGAVANDLFGILPTDRKLIEFTQKHREIIEDELKKIALSYPDLLPYLTDALRMQTICDYQEGTNTLPTLLRAQALGVLIEDRPTPMPSTFIIHARNLGSKYGLVELIEK